MLQMKYMVIVNKTWQYSYDNLRDSLTKAIQNSKSDATPWIPTIDLTLKLGVYRRMYIYVNVALNPLTMRR